MGGCSKKGRTESLHSPDVGLLSSSSLVVLLLEELRGKNCYFVFLDFLEAGQGRCERKVASKTTHNATDFTQYQTHLAAAWFLEFLIQFM